ncbi:MAG: threonine synthase [Cyclobacteriaceae bacterium]
MIATREKTTLFSHLRCAGCQLTLAAHERATFANCDRCGRSPWLAEYGFLSSFTRDRIDQTNRSMWRYGPMLPVFDPANVVSLGEGWTPILPLKKLGLQLALPQLFVKDESMNPTGSFKARGMSMAISKAKELGISTCIVPTAGNAGGALSAYCARAGMKAIVVMPRHTPTAFKDECRLLGAEVVEVEGLISDCAAKAGEIKDRMDAFDLSTMKEPYRLEGKKTMGYEIAEQFNWNLPDVILYPTGGGTGLIGMWKAFHEMIELGWIEEKLPRMYAVQAENCRPVVDVFEGKIDSVKGYRGRATLANGLAVPNPFAEKLIMETLYESGGAALAVTDKEIKDAMIEMAEKEGMLICPEGAALLPALRRLVRAGTIDRDERVLLLNTGSAYKYLESL